MTTTQRHTESIHARDADSDARERRKVPRKAGHEVYNTDIGPVHGWSVQEAWAIEQNVVSSVVDDSLGDPTQARFIVESILGY